MKCEDALGAEDWDGFRGGWGEGREAWEPEGYADSGDGNARGALPVPAQYLLSATK